MLFNTSGCRVGMSIELLLIAIFKTLIVRALLALYVKLRENWSQSMVFVVAAYYLITSSLELIKTWNLSPVAMESLHIGRLLCESYVGMNMWKPSSYDSSKQNNFSYFWISLAALIAGVIRLGAQVPSILVNFLSHNWVSLGISMMLLYKWCMEKSIIFRYLGPLYSLRFSLSALPMIYSDLLVKEILPDIVTKTETAILFIDAILLMLLLIWSHQHDQGKSFPPIRTKFRHKFSCLESNLLFIVTATLVVLPELLLLCVPGYFPESSLVETLLGLGYSNDSTLEECSNITFGSELTKVLNSQLTIILLLFLSGKKY
mmetsp:Transcript_26551/g.42674  ORF Transcript_26551/g.42674 Transcript_26551/m.42674 type:complete len:317 (-) Transcript_26551:1041-1991(-)